MTCINNYSANLRNIWNIHEWILKNFCKKFDFCKKSWKIRTLMYWKKESFWKKIKNSFLQIISNCLGFKLCYVLGFDWKNNGYSAEKIARHFGLHHITGNRHSRFTNVFRKLGRFRMRQEYISIIKWAILLELMCLFVSMKQCSSFSFSSFIISSPWLDCFENPMKISRCRYVITDCCLSFSKSKIYTYY